MNIIPEKKEEYDEYVKMNQDPYGKGVVDYGKDWMCLMEEQIEHGKSVAESAEETKYDAKPDGITGFMFGCVMSALAYFWIHGEELRKWHNLRTQIGDEGERANKEGGVLNPALLNIG